MSRSELLDSLGGALSDAVDWLTAAQTPYAVVGGLAAALLGRPRMTRDIDLLADVPEEDWPAFAEAAVNAGFTHRVNDPLDFARQSRVLLLTHEASGTPIDVIFAGLPFERNAIASSRILEVNGWRIRVVRPEDLMLMKAVAQRPRDVADLEGISQAQPDLDWPYLLETARQFAQALDASEVLDILRRVRPPQGE